MHGRINTHIIKKLIIPENIIVNILNNNICIFKEYNSNNTIKHNINKYISINIENDTIILSAILDKTTKNIKILALINTTYILFKNYFKGLTIPFSKTLILKGVGYKADYQKNMLKLFIGFTPYYIQHTRWHSCNTNYSNNYMYKWHIKK